MGGGALTALMPGSREVGRGRSGSADASRGGSREVGRGALTALMPGSREQPKRGARGAYANTTIPRTGKESRVFRLQDQTGSACAATNLSDTPMTLCTFHTCRFK